MINVSIVERESSAFQWNKVKSIAWINDCDDSCVSNSYILITTHKCPPYRATRSFVYLYIHAYTFVSLLDIHYWYSLLELTRLTIKLNSQFYSCTWLRIWGFQNFMIKFLLHRKLRNFAILSTMILSMTFTCYFFRIPAPECIVSRTVQEHVRRTALCSTAMRLCSSIHVDFRSIFAALNYKLIEPMVECHIRHLWEDFKWPQLHVYCQHYNQCWWEVSTRSTNCVVGYLKYLSSCHDIVDLNTNSCVTFSPCARLCRTLIKRNKIAPNEKFVCRKIFKLTQNMLPQDAYARNNWIKSYAVTTTLASTLFFFLYNSGYIILFMTFG